MAFVVFLHSNRENKAISIHNSRDLLLLALSLRESNIFNSSLDRKP